MPGKGQPVPAARHDLASVQPCETLRPSRDFALVPACFRDLGSLSCRWDLNETRHTRGPEHNVPGTRLWNVRSQQGLPKLAPGSRTLPERAAREQEGGWGQVEWDSLPRELYGGVSSQEMKPDTGRLEDGRSCGLQPREGLDGGGDKGPVRADARQVRKWRKAWAENTRVQDLSLPSVKG